MKTYLSILAIMLTLYGSAILWGLSDTIALLLAICGTPALMIALDRLGINLPE